MDNLITVAVLTHNNESVIERCLKSCSGKFNVLVVDSGSSDKTIDICKHYNAKIIYNEFKSFKEQRNFALGEIETEYTLFLDSDEKVSEDLSLFLTEKFLSFSKKTNSNIYEIFRTEYYNQKEIIYGFGRSNYQTRLLKTSNVFYDGDVHEFPCCKEGFEAIKLDRSLRIDHNPMRNLGSIMLRMVPYAELASRKKINNGKRIGLLLILINFNWQFLRLAWMGRKDGYISIVSAFSEAISRTITYLYVYDHNHLTRR